VKVPLSFWLLVAGRLWLYLRREGSRDADDQVLPLTIGLFLVIAATCSARNYGIRYLLPLSPLAIIWVSRIAEAAPSGASLRVGCKLSLIGLGLAGQAFAVASVHPFELTYFNELAGGPLGGRHVLADSNLDWGQGLLALAKLQRLEPEIRDLTLYYFGDTDPRHYGVQGKAYVIDAVGSRTGLPSLSSVTTRYLAVSASLQWGPWGPPGFFSALDSVSPVRMTQDTTIAIYRTHDLCARQSIGHSQNPHQ